MKVAVVTDTNSSISKEEANRLGVYVVPMPFMIDDEEFFEDITLTRKEFYEKMENGASVVTSQPSPEAVMNMWDEILKTHDALVYIPMSSGLSGSCQTAMMLADDYDDQVFVVNNQRISPTQRDSVLEALKMAKNGMTAKDIKEKLEETKFDSTIYITVGTLDYLKRGGRVTPAAAAIGSLLKIKPVLAIHGEKLDKFATARSFKLAKPIMINAVLNDMENLIGCSDPKEYNIAVAYSNNLEDAEEFARELKEIFPDNDIFVVPLSLSVACHIGPLSLAIAVSKKL
ncbi:MAG: DegV family protein [Lachnospiraceae bacterium]|nr:DegV family protein [Lachnospiraceae bacterium]